jgi:hypothetical protein
VHIIPSPKVLYLVVDVDSQARISLSAKLKTQSLSHVLDWAFQPCLLPKIPETDCFLRERSELTAFLPFWTLSAAVMGDICGGLE